MKLILGSKSPRRKELLSLLGYQFEVRLKDTDESYPSDISVQEVALFIANQKSLALLNELKPDEVLICADTTVIVDNQILGKPQTTNEAIAMLEKLSGKKHTVITGVVISSFNKQLKFSCSTIVSVLPLSKADIKYYIEHFKPFDKAGSYGIQEWFGSTYIDYIEGSFNNVVGLPTHEIYNALKSFS
jgi:septum formation protein